MVDSSLEIICYLPYAVLLSSIAYIIANYLDGSEHQFDYQSTMLIQCCIVYLYICKMTGLLFEEKIKKMRTIPLPVQY